MEGSEAGAEAGAAAATGIIAGLGVFFVIMLAVCVFFIVVMWKLFTKAGQPGWAALIPIYNIYVLLQIAGKPAWWLLLMFIPFVNIIISILVTVALASSFGKGGGFVVGMILLPVIFYPILAFGSAEYKGAPA